MIEVNDDYSITIKHCLDDVQTKKRLEHKKDNGTNKPDHKIPSVTWKRKEKRNAGEIEKMKERDKQR